MNAKTLVRCGGFGLTLAATASTAQSPAPEPAARLVRAVPVLEPSAAIIVRGLAPTPDATEAKAASRWMSGPMPTTVKPLPQPTSVAPESRPTLAPVGADSTWQSLKNYLIGPPKPPTAPTQGPAFQPSAPQPSSPRPPMQPMLMNPPTPAQQPGVYAGPPAYRWYGWGTTTPGRNPLAPAGQSPRGSAGWYAQTGATPGAFPVTAQAPSAVLANAQVPQYGPSGPLPALVSGPYQYAGPGDTFPTTLPPLPPGAVVIADGLPAPFSMPQTVSAPPTFEPQPVVLGTGEPLPPPALPLPPTGYAAPSFGVPMFQPSGPSAFAVPMLPIPVPPPAPPSVNWSSAGGGAVPFGVPTRGLAGPQWGTPTTIARPQAPVPPPAVTLDDRIRHAASGSADVIEIKYVGPSKLRIRLKVKTAAEARTAVDAVSAVPMLSPYVVDFEVGIAAK